MADVDGDGVATSVANGNEPAGNQEQKQEGEE